MSALLQECLERTFGIEGGYSNDPLDRGGETIWGISRVHHPDLWLTGPPTKAQATEFYTKLWAECGASFLEAQDRKDIAALLFDMAVNHGPSRAVSLLQRAVGATVDGKIGPKTLDSTTVLCKTYGEPAVRNCIIIERIALYHRIVSGDSTQMRFFKGWIGRALQFYPTTKQLQ